MFRGVTPKWFIESVKRYAAKRVSPHVLRHTGAMVVLQATQDIRKVSLWLGHSNLTTTEVYVRADPTEKLEGYRRGCAAEPSQKANSGRPTDCSRF